MLRALSLQVFLCLAVMVLLLAADLAMTRYLYLEGRLPGPISTWEPGLVFSGVLASFLGVGAAIVWLGSSVGHVWSSGSGAGRVVGTGLLVLALALVPIFGLSRPPHHEPFLDGAADWARQELDPDGVRAWAGSIAETGAVGSEAWSDAVAAARPMYVERDRGSAVRLHWHESGRHWGVLIGPADSTGLDASPDLLVRRIGPGFFVWFDQSAERGTAPDA